MMITVHMTTMITMATMTSMASDRPGSAFQHLRRGATCEYLVVDDDCARRGRVSRSCSNKRDTNLRRSAHFRMRSGSCGTRPPDLLITDVDLKDADGLQLLVDTSTRVPTIVLTGSYNLVLESEVRREGAVYMVKPVSPERLLDQVKSMLDKA